MKTVSIQKPLKDYGHHLKDSEMKEIEKKYNPLVLFLGEHDFKLTCTVRGLDTGERCPEYATKEINGDPMCEWCYENFKHLITTNKAQVTNPRNK